MWMKNFVTYGLRKGDETPTLCQMGLALKITYWMIDVPRAYKLQVGKQINKQNTQLIFLDATCSKEGDKHTFVTTPTTWYVTKQDV